VIVAYNMSEWRTFRDEVRTAPRSDMLVMVTTVLLTVMVDLTVALSVGMVLAGAGTLAVRQRLTARR
jgi:SulP family sulfate permease